MVYMSAASGERTGEEFWGVTTDIIGFDQSSVSVVEGMRQLRLPHPANRLQQC